MRLIPHDPTHLVALLEGEEQYKKASGIDVANGVRDFLLAGSTEFMTQLRAATEPDAWRFGFAIVHQADNLFIGLCSFTSFPDSDGCAEIAYGIAPTYQKKGYATEAAAALVEFAARSGRVATVQAYTLPEINASTGVLKKCGFEKIGEIIDSENNLVWRWERKIQD